MGLPETDFKGKFHVKHGYAFKGEYFSPDGKYMVLTPGNFNEEGGFRVREGKEKYYSGEIPEDYILEKGDLIVAMTEQGEGLLGSAAVIPKSDAYLHNQRLGLITVDKTKINKNFLYFLLNASHVRQQIRNSSSGTKVRHTSPERIYKVKIGLPKIKTQKKIAAILSAYDDLIENNKRSISLLEKMAEEIYREWFIRFRFPGYQNTIFEKGLPKRWGIKKIGDIYKTSSGGTPSRKNPSNYEGKINWLKTGELKNTFTFKSEEKITIQGLEGSSAKLFPINTVVIAMYCAMPYISILSEESATNQACCAFLPKKEYLSHVYTYYLIKFAQNHIIQFAHGAAQQNLSQELIKGFTLLVANKENIIQFTKTVEPIFDQVRKFEEIIDNLEKTKNQLLPRLISGKFSVENLNVQFPPSMRAENMDALKGT